MARANPWDEFQVADETPRAFERTGQTTAQPQSAPAPSPGDFSQFQEVQDVDRSTPLSAYAVGDPQLPDAQLDPTGAQEYARPEDMAFASMAQKLVDTPGTTRADFDALSERYGYPRYGEDLDSALAARDSAGTPFRVS